MAAPTPTRGRPKKHLTAQEILQGNLRFEELRELGTRRDRQQEVEFRRLQKQMERKTLPSADTHLEQFKTVEDFWASNRKAAGTQDVERWLAQQERVRDETFWMTDGWRCSPDDELFVGLDEGLASMDVFIAEHGLISDDPAEYKHPYLKDFRPGWPVWLTERRDVPNWGRLFPYFRDLNRLSALAEESLASEIYAKYGIRVSLSAYMVNRFKARIADHRTTHNFDAHVKGQSKGPQGEPPDAPCWLCQFQNAQGSQ
jgi:hypothetical protein